MMGRSDPVETWYVVLLLVGDRVGWSVATTSTVHVGAEMLMLLLRVDQHQRIARVRYEGTHEATDRYGCDSTRGRVGVDVVLGCCCEKGRCWIGR